MRKEKGKCGPFRERINGLLLDQYDACDAHDDSYEMMIRSSRGFPAYRKRVDKQLLVDLIDEGAPVVLSVLYYGAVRIFGGLNIWLKKKFRK